MMNPKTKRNLFRILPFGLIWLIMSWYNLVIETLATGNVNPDPDTQIDLSIPVFLFASFASAMVGIFIGAMEIIWLEKHFKSISFFKKIIYKFFIYTLVLFIAVIILYPIAATIELQLAIWEKEIWLKLLRFLASTSFLSTGISLGFSLILSLIYAGISENIGHRVFTNIIRGKYHQPKEEERIFMFLDMKSSTTIAEQLGNKTYFQFLQDYYNSLTNAIIKHHGEVYQYIGDEIVITWNFNQGFQNNNCIECFYSMKASIKRRSDYFQKRYNLIPDFKAGIHSGAVTTGQIGAMKKEIFYTGDVLNTAARIQGLCKDYQVDLLLSKSIERRLKSTNETKLQALGAINLRGKQESMEIFSIGNH